MSFIVIAVSNCQNRGSLNSNLLGIGMVSVFGKQKTKKENGNERRAETRRDSSGGEKGRRGPGVVPRVLRQMRMDWLPYQLSLLLHTWRMHRHASSAVTFNSQATRCNSCQMQDCIAFAISSHKRHAIRRCEPLLAGCESPFRGRLGRH